MLIEEKLWLLRGRVSVSFLHSLLSQALVCTTKIKANVKENQKLTSGGVTLNLRACG